MEGSKHEFYEPLLNLLFSFAQIHHVTNLLYSPRFKEHARENYNVYWGDGDGRFLT